MFKHLCQRNGIRFEAKKTNEELEPNMESIMANLQRKRNVSFAQMEKRIADQTSFEPNATSMTTTYK
jgi:hypothetical protein